MIASLLQRAGAFRPGLALQSTIPKVLVVTAMAGGAGSMLSAGSAHAGLFTWGEIFPGTGTGVCNGPTPDPRCTEGDKTVSNFTTDYVLTSTPTNTNTSATTINFTQALGIWDLNVSFLPGPSVGGPYFLSYDIEVNAPGKTFDKIGLDSTCNLSGVGPCSVTKEIAYYLGNVLQPIDPTLTKVSTNGGPASPSTIGVGVTKLRVTDTWLTSGVGSLDTFSDNFTQRDHTDVPGPLPLMGAGAAFGFGRKLRNRIKANSIVKA